MGPLVLVLGYVSSNHVDYSNLHQLCGLLVEISQGRRAGSLALCTAWRSSQIGAEDDGHYPFGKQQMPSNHLITKHRFLRFYLSTEANEDHQQVSYWCFAPLCHSQENNICN